MITFYYDVEEKTLYVYNANLLIEKLFDVKALEKDNRSGQHLVFGLRGDLVAVLYGTQIENKIE